MNYTELITKLREALDIVGTLDIQQLNEMTAFQDPSKDMPQYLANIKMAKEKGITKPRCATINGIRIPDECFKHVNTEGTVPGHDLTEEQWTTFIDNIDIDTDHRLKSNKNPRYNGEPHLYTTKIEDKYYGYVLELFPNKPPILVTAFWSDRNSIEAWIYNNTQRKPKQKRNLK